MIDLNKQIQKIEKEIRETPYHKATEHHIGKLRARLSKLKARQMRAGEKTSGGKQGFSVKKQGNATVTLVGPPSVGKSTLLNKLTNARSKIAPYAFTTVTVVPGMMDYNNAKIQILDVPGLIQGAEVGKGRGKEVLSVARGSDLLLIMCDAKSKKVFVNIPLALEKSGIKINKKPPKVRVIKKVRGGLQIQSNIKQDLDKETIIQVAREFGVVNGEVVIQEKLTMDRLIDAFSPNRVYIPAIFVINKVDELKKPGRHYSNIVYDSTGKILINISAIKGKGLKRLKETIWKKLELVQIFLVRNGEEPTTNHPLIMKVNDTLSQVTEKIGSEFAQNITRAIIWGNGAKFPGQEVSLSTRVQEGMQVRFI